MIPRARRPSPARALRLNPEQSAPLPRSKRSILPGFGLSLGYTLFYLTLLVLVPLGALVLKTAQLSWDGFLSAVTDPVVVASYRLSFQASAAAAAINGVFGVVVAWVLVRYSFPGRRILDAVVDFPFALPTAVAGLTFGSLYTKVPWVELPESVPAFDAYYDTKALWPAESYARVRAALSRA